MSAPAISVIVPAYCTERFIGACLDSVFGQTDAPAFEVIVVDDCTPDRSAEIASKYPVRLLHHDTNRGLSAARNTGINAAKGDYLLFVDSDDTIAPDTLTRLWNHVTAHPGVDMVYGRIEPVGGDPLMKNYLSLDRSGIREFDDSQAGVRRVHAQVPEMAQGHLVRRKWLIENGLLFTEGLIHEDFDWHIRAFGKVGSYAAELGAPFYFYRVHEASITGRQKPERKRRIVYGILEREIPRIDRLDRPAMLLLTNAVIYIKQDGTTADDDLQYRRVLTAIAKHPSARLWHRLALFMYRFSHLRIPRGILINALR